MEKLEINIEASVESYSKVLELVKVIRGIQKSTDVTALSL